VYDECRRYYSVVKIASLRAAGLAAGSSPLPRVGIGVEVEDYRRWAEGDDVRHIDWRITARKPSHLGGYEIHVREYRAERNLKPLVIVDATASMGFWDKPLSAVYAASLILQILSTYGDQPSLLVLSDTVKIYRGVSGGALSLLLAREVCRSKPRGDLALTDCTRHLRRGKPVFVVTDYAHSVGEVREFLLHALTLQKPVLFTLITSPMEKMDYGSAMITLSDPEDGVLRGERGSTLHTRVKAHITTIRSIISSYSRYIEVEGTRDLANKSYKIYLSVAKTREGSF